MDLVVNIVDRTPIPTILVDASYVIRHANGPAASVLGHDEETLRQRSVIDFVHPDDRERAVSDLRRLLAGGSRGETAEYRVGGVGDTWATVSVVATSLSGRDRVSGVLLFGRDITEQQTRVEALTYMAMTDPVTGLGNRRWLEDHLVRILETGRPIVIAMVDLDNFRRVNDWLGFTAGDAVLAAAARALSASAPSSASVSHLGGDSFVIVMYEADVDRACAQVRDSLRRLAETRLLLGTDLQISATAGIAIRNDASTAESLVRDADAALARAKVKARTDLTVFTDEMRSELVERAALEGDLRHAVARDELELHVQPVVRLSDGELMGGEALLRWRRRGGEWIDPASFIAVAEETGAILDIGRWAFERAVQAVLSGRIPRISVNVSPRQLLDSRWVGQVEETLRHQGVSPELLAFEITETAAVENFEVAADRLGALRSIGCHVGLDDFGTGHSSLGYLRRLPLDFLKLDRDLTADVDRERRAARIIESVVDLAHALSLQVIAEGVEREPQRLSLVVAGCDLGQGWLFGHPTPA